MAHNFKPDVAVKFAALLRSGRIPQTFFTLAEMRADGMICCCAEGVLCELYKNETGNGAWGGAPYVGSSTSLQFKVDGARSTTRAPDAVRRWALVEDPAGAAPTPMVSGDFLMSLNDRERSSFETIADLLDPKP